MKTRTVSLPMDFLGPFYNLPPILGNLGSFFSLIIQGHPLGLHS